MSSLAILPLAPKQLQILQEAGFETCQDVLSLSPTELAAGKKYIMFPECNFADTNKDTISLFTTMLSKKPLKRILKFCVQL